MKTVKHPSTLPLTSHLHTYILLRQPSQPTPRQSATTAEYAWLPMPWPLHAAALTARACMYRRPARVSRREKNWKRWGPYLSERQWGTVREDYSEDGSAWDYFSHDHSRMRAYRWGEDGLLGITDRECRLCFAFALWNGTPLNPMTGPMSEPVCRVISPPATLRQVPTSNRLLSLVARLFRTRAYSAGCQWAPSAPPTLTYAHRGRPVNTRLSPQARMLS